MHGFVVDSYCKQNSHNNRKHYFIRRFGLCLPSSGINEMRQLERENKDAVLRHLYCITSYRPLCVKSSKGLDEPLMLRSVWCCCIRRDSSRWSFFWPTLLPNISSCLQSKWCVGLANKCLQTSECWSNLCSLVQVIKFRQVCPMQFYPHVHVVDGETALLHTILESPTQAIHTWRK